MNLSNNKIGNLYLVATPIGNLNEITFRAVEILKSVDLILCEDTRMSKKLLEHLQIHTPMSSYHAHNETQKADLMILKLLAGLNLALICDAGMPGINDPGAVLVNLAHQKHIPLFAVGGVSALSSALAVSGLQGDFLFKGFVPHKNKQRKDFLITLMEGAVSSLFFVGTSRVLDSIETITLIDPNQKIILVKEISKIYEKTLKTNAIEIRNWLWEDKKHQKGEFVIIIEKTKGRDTDNKKLISLKKMLKVMLLEGISVSQSARIASKISTFPKNTCYKTAQALDKQSQI